MGNSNKKPQEYEVVSSFKPAEWVNKQKREGFQMWENSTRNIRADVYSLTSQLKQCDLDHYEMRHNNNPNIVQVHNLQIRKQENLCSNSVGAHVFVQRILYRLNEVNDLTKIEALTVLRSVYNGFNTLSTFYGPIEPFEDLICFNEQGKPKVWINANLSQNRVKIQRRQNIRKISNYNQAYVNKIFDMVENRTTNRELPEGLKNKFRNCSPKSYFEAANIIQEFATEQAIQIPSSIRSRKYQINYTLSKDSNQNEMTNALLPRNQLKSVTPFPSNLYTSARQSNLTSPGQQRKKQLVIFNNGPTCQNPLNVADKRVMHSPSNVSPSNFIPNSLSKISSNQIRQIASRPLPSPTINKVIPPPIKIQTQNSPNDKKINAISFNKQPKPFLQSPIQSVKNFPLGLASPTNRISYYKQIAPNIDNNKPKVESNFQHKNLPRPIINFRFPSLSPNPNPIHIQNTKTQSQPPPLQVTNEIEPTKPFDPPELIPIGERQNLGNQSNNYQVVINNETVNIGESNSQMKQQNQLYESVQHDSQQHDQQNNEAISNMNVSNTVKIPQITNSFDLQKSYEEQANNHKYKIETDSMHKDQRNNTEDPQTNITQNIRLQNNQEIQNQEHDCYPFQKQTLPQQQQQEYNYNLKRVATQELRLNQMIRLQSKQQQVNPGTLEQEVERNDNINAYRHTYMHKNGQLYTKQYNANDRIPDDAKYEEIQQYIRNKYKISNQNKLNRLEESAKSEVTPYNKNEYEDSKMNSNKLQSQLYPSFDEPQQISNNNKEKDSNQERKYNKKEETQERDMLDVGFLEKSLDKKYSTLKLQQRVRNVEAQKQLESEHQFDISKLQKNLIKFEESKVTNKLMNRQQGKCQPKFQTSQVKNINSIMDHQLNDQQSIVQCINSQEKSASAYEYKKRISTRYSKYSQDILNIEEKYNKYVANANKNDSSKLVLKQKQQNYEDEYQRGNRMDYIFIENQANQEPYHPITSSKHEEMRSFAVSQVVPIHKNLTYDDLRKFLWS